MLRIALALLYMSTPAWGQTCTIVTDGTIAIYEHEIAHCNGWWHEPFAPNLVPPREYVHPYDGLLTVYLTGHNYGEHMAIMSLAPMDTKYIFRWDETVETICRQLWQERGIAASKKFEGRLSGCAVP
jgi:hypothetical protein